MRGRQVLRWWSLLRALEQARLGMTLEDFQRLDLGCSRRTLYRDLEQIAELAPVVREGDRYRLAGATEGAWNLPVEPTMVLAIMLSQSLLEPLDGTVLVEPLRELRQRLSAMLRPAARAYLDELRHTLLGTTPGAPDYAERDPVIRAIQDAICRQHRLALVYAKANGPREDRVVEPYFTWVNGGRLYLVGLDVGREDVRTFAVQRIDQATVLDEPFEPDATFDPEEFVRRGFGVFHGPVHHVVLDFDADVAYLARERRFHRTQRLRERADGTVRLTMDAAGLPEIAAWVASFGGRVQPVAPAELVDRVRSIFEDGLKRIGGG